MAHSGELALRSDGESPDDEGGRFYGERREARGGDDAGGEGGKNIDPGTSLGNFVLFILSSWLVEHVVKLNKLLVGSGKSAYELSPRRMGGEVPLASVMCVVVS